MEIQGRASMDNGYSETTEHSCLRAIRDEQRSKKSSHIFFHDRRRAFLNLSAPEPSPSPLASLLPLPTHTLSLPSHNSKTSPNSLSRTAALTARPPMTARPRRPRPIKPTAHVPASLCMHARPLALPHSTRPPCVIPGLPYNTRVHAARRWEKYTSARA